jgi:translation elongation factor EF-1alpha
MEKKKPTNTFAVIGPSEVGKSKLISKLLLKYSPNGLGHRYENRLHEIKIRGDNSESGLLSIHEYERKRQITVVSYQWKINTAKTDIFLIDTPGNLKYIRNLFRGVSYCDNVILMIPLSVKNFDEIKEFIFICSAIEIKNLLILVNIDYKGFPCKEKYENKCFEISEICIQSGINKECFTFFPISLMPEYNIFEKSDNFSFNEKNCTLIEILQGYIHDDVHNNEKNPEALVIYNYPKINDETIIIAKLVKGELLLGQQINIYSAVTSTSNVNTPTTILSIKIEENNFEKIDSQIFPPGTNIGIKLNNCSIKRAGCYLYKSEDEKFVKKIKNFKATILVLNKPYLKVGSRPHIYSNCGDCVIHIEDMNKLNELDNHYDIKFKPFFSFLKSHPFKPYDSDKKNGKFLIRESGMLLAVGKINEIVYY